MTDRFPDVFIQIHYHLRAGGVSTVIKSYFKAFYQCGGNFSKSYMICKRDEAAACDELQAHLINIDDCDYQTFTSCNQYKSISDNLYQKLDDFFCNILESNVAVVAHNLVLAKNPALASVFKKLACKWSACGFRFYSVIHDFAEEGRAELLEQLSFLENNDIDIRKDIYCIDAPVQFIVPSPGSFSLLHNNKFPAFLLSNPVDVDKLVIDDSLKKKLLDRLKRKADSDNSFFDIKKKIMYYPVRLISRKNIYEAIAISFIVYDCNLLAGSSGCGCIDSGRYEILRQFVKKHRLPVVFDVFRIFENNNNCKTSVVKSIMNIADIILSTSIAEGFGYALFDPWIQDKPLIARRPSGYVFPDGWNCGSLYSYLPVPIEWVSIDILDEMYKEFFMRCYGKKLSWKICDLFIKNSTIDFAVLSEQMQRDILDMVFMDNVKLLKWKRLLESEISGWPGSCKLMDASVNSIDKHRKLICSEFSYSDFLKNFLKCFSIVPSPVSSTADLIGISENFESDTFFKLLLSGQI